MSDPRLLMVLVLGAVALALICLMYWAATAPCNDRVDRPAGASIAGGYCVE